jgi:transcription elongation GreA/GreB family factor
MARALLKKTLDDEIVVNTAGGSAHYYIVAIQYTALDEDS